MESKQLFLNIQKTQSERWMKRFSEDRKPEVSDQFIPVSYRLLDNPKFRNGLLIKKRFRTYLWIRRYIVRGFKLGDPCDVFSNYWMNDELAVSTKLEKIAKDLGLAKSTVSDHIRQLQKDGRLRRYPQP